MLKVLDATAYLTKQRTIDESISCGCASPGNETQSSADNKRGSSDKRQQRQHQQ